MFRHWRIQVFFICFTLFLAVIVFWVRSYTWQDQVEWTYKPGDTLIAFSVDGNVILHSQKVSPILPGLALGWHITSTQVTQKIKESFRSHLNSHGISFLGFYIFVGDKVRFISIPYWFVSIVFALLCGLPWYWRRFNFSLRTLFFAVTVLAVLLGFIAWLTHSPAAK